MDLINLEVVSYLKETSDVFGDNMRERFSRHVVNNLNLLKPFAKSKEDENDLVKLTTRFMIMQMRNSFNLADSKTSRIEVSGVLPFGSLFNHSCDPNVMRVTYENKIVFVVIKPVVKDHQLFTSYG